MDPPVEKSNQIEKFEAAREDTKNYAGCSDSIANFEVFTGLLWTSCKHMPEQKMIQHFSFGDFASLHGPSIAHI
ncbi:hypothetical protein NC651_014670 [Populus alba x Populus x berolinensis]|nr:hypothetical protein NC651_014189 [Populus alba x Populus x berolinensis]KAJ6920525.1 hypothetical protein NC651_014192 [Populus alba x Populus x berolinensis]KAJ6921158.1 hypothetical protein NC651_014670 [Populus alba x Populus x berolinensis]